jgi:hypothetical protein
MWMCCTHLAVPSPNWVLDFQAQLNQQVVEERELAQMTETGIRSWSLIFLKVWQGHISLLELKLD